MAKPPRRLLIKGGSGAGKSTLARDLAQRLGLPYVELDALHHGPNWTAVPTDRFRALVAETLDDRRGWVVDGNYDSKLQRLLLDRAELIVWLDLPLGTKLSRLARRTTRRMARREVLWNGNRESLRGVCWGAESLFVWAVRSHFHQRRAWPLLLADPRTVRLRSPRAVTDWLHDFVA
ncbi:MAG TPA: shikimate kinase [Polyangiales bacterium]